MKEVKPIIKYGWMRAILFALTFLMLMIFSNIITDRIIGNFNPGQQQAGESDYLPGLRLLLSALISLVVAVLTVYFFRKMIDRQNLESLGLKLKGNIPHAATGFFLALLLLGLGTFVLVANNNLQWTGIKFDAGQVLIGLGIMIMVAFSEELVFRGYILNNLMGSMNKWLALTYSALLFALFHLNNPGINFLALINIFLAGLLLGINYIFTKNLWFPFLFHFAWNFYQGTVLGYKVSGVPLKSLFEQQLTGHHLLTGGIFGFEGSVVAALLTILSVLSIGWIYWKQEL